jgi:hypothetical protein
VLKEAGINLTEKLLTLRELLSYLESLYMTFGIISDLERRRKRQACSKKNICPHGSAENGLGSFPEDPRFSVAMCPEPILGYWSWIGSQNGSKVRAAS